MTRRRRRVAAAALCAAALLALAWFGDAGSAIPIAWSSDGPTEPLLQPPATALRLVEQRLALTGGMPHDARLTRFDPFTAHMLLASAPGRVVYVSAYNFTFEPADAVAPDDRITASVDAETIRTCVGGGVLESPYAGRRSEPSCRHYRIAFPLRVAGLRRNWRPRAVRVAARWRDRMFAPRFAAPASVEPGCAGGGTDAFRRVVAAITNPLALKGRFDPQALWDPTVAAARAGHGIAGTWLPPYPKVHFSEPLHGGVNDVPIRAAVVLDVPIGERPERLVLVRATILGHDEVGALEAASDEPVCPPLRTADAAAPVVGPWDWDTIVLIVRKRAEDEARWLAAFGGTTVSSRVVRIDRHAGETSTIAVEASIDRARWRGLFAVDERVPEISGAEFTRLADATAAIP